MLEGHKKNGWLAALQVGLRLKVAKIFLLLVAALSVEGRNRLNVECQFSPVSYLKINVVSCVYNDIRL